MEAGGTKYIVSPNKYEELKTTRQRLHQIASQKQQGDG